MIGAPLLDREQVAKALRRLADALEAGQASIENFVVHNEMDAAQEGTVFIGQHVKVEATSVRVLIGDA